MSKLQSLAVSLHWPEVRSTYDTSWNWPFKTATDLPPLQFRRLAPTATGYFPLSDSRFLDFENIDHLSQVLILLSFLALTLKESNERGGGEGAWIETNLLELKACHGLRLRLSRN
jgi:hypothetical protein